MTHLCTYGIISPGVWVNKTLTRVTVSGFKLTNSSVNNKLKYKILQLQLISSHNLSLLLQQLYDYY